MKTTNDATTEIIAGQSKSGTEKVEGKQAMFNASYGFVQQNEVFVIVIVIQPLPQVAQSQNQINKCAC